MHIVFVIEMLLHYSVIKKSSLENNQNSSAHAELLINPELQIREDSNSPHFKDHSLDHLWPIDFNFL